MWERINGHKQIFVEPRESGSFKMTVNAYTDEVTIAMVIDERWYLVER